MNKSQEVICISSQEKENSSQELLSDNGNQEKSQEREISTSSQGSDVPPTTPSQGIRLGLSKFSVNQKKPAVTTTLLGSTKLAPMGHLGKARVSGLSRPPKKTPTLHQPSLLSMFERKVKKADLGPSHN